MPGRAPLTTNRISLPQEQIEDVNAAQSEDLRFVCPRIAVLPRLEVRTLRNILHIAN